MKNFYFAILRPLQKSGGDASSPGPTTKTAGKIRYFWRRGRRRYWICSGLILFFSAGVLTLRAQTNASAGTVNTNAVGAILALVTTNAPDSAATNASAHPKPAQQETTISADGPAEFDLNNHWITYQDHVCVSNAQMKLTCEWLRSNMPQNGERVTNIVAETNVVINLTLENGQKVRVTGQKGIYYYHVANGVTNETVTITNGPPQMEQGSNTMTGDAFIYDFVARKLMIPSHAGAVYSQPAGGASASNGLPGQVFGLPDRAPAKTNSQDSNNSSPPDNPGTN